MSSRRSIVWLLFFIVLAVSAHVLVSTRAGRTVLPPRPEVLAPQADRATFLELVRHGTPAAAAVLTDRWRLVAPFAAAVDAGIVRRALDALAFQPVSDFLSEAEMRRLGRTLADFGLADPPLRLTVRRELREMSVGLGGLTPDGGGVYATVSGHPGVCVIASNVFARLNLGVDDLRNPKLLPDDVGAVSSIDVRRPKGKFVRVSRSGENGWLMSEPSRAPVSAARVAALLKLLSEADAETFVWPTVDGQTAAMPSVSLLAGYGLDAESAMTVSLAQPDGSTRYVSFGKHADAETVYALAQDGGLVATVPVALRDRLLAEADSFADLKIFPYEESAVTTLSIADGELVYLVARMPGGDWRIDSPVSAPADQDAVRALLQTVLSLRATERDPKGLVVSVSTNSPAVAVSRDALLVQNRLEDLRSKTILRIPSDRIRRLSLTSDAGRHESVSWDAADRTWILSKPDGAALNGLALAGVLSALDPLQAQSVVRLRIAASEAVSYGLERPRFTLAVDPTAEGAVRRNILIGASAPGGGSYATVGSNDAVVILPDETVRILTMSFASKE